MYFLIFHFCNLLTFVLNVSCYAETYFTVVIKMLFNNIWVLTEFYLISGNRYSGTVTYVIGVSSTFSTDGSFNPRTYSICAPISLRHGETGTVRCNTPVRGRYVTVYPITTIGASLCEVEVYGPIIPGKCK